MEDIKQFVLYKTENGNVKLEIFLEEESLWLSQKMMAELFEVEVNTINYHIKDVYALGDTIFTKNILTNDDLYVPFGDVANKEAIILAKYLSGENVSWKGALKSFATSFYDIKIAQTGLSLEEAKKHGFNAEKLEMKAMAKNSGFEDSKPNKVEIIYDKDKKVLLGGTIIGYDAVAQFIDQIAIVITFDIPIEKFIDIDFAYSPTNASVWNPLLVAYRKIIK